MIPLDLQASIEHSYSREHARKLIHADISNLDLEPCISSILQWIDGDHYPTKKDSLLAIEHIDWNSLLVDILAVVIPTVSAPITSIVGQVAHLLPLDYEVAVKRMGEILYKMAESDLINIYPANVNGVIEIESVHTLSEQTLWHLSKTRFLPPMLVPPRVLRSNKDSGYLTVKSPILSRGTKIDNRELCLDLINLANSCAFSLDIDFLRASEDISEYSSKEEETQAEHLRKLTNEMCVDIYHQGNECYFNHFYDARGRLYSRGYHLHYQGNSYRKAMLNFHKSTPIEVKPEDISAFI